MFLELLFAFFHKWFLVIIFATFENCIINIILWTMPYTCSGANPLSLYFDYMFARLFLLLKYLSLLYILGYLVCFHAFLRIISSKCFTNPVNFGNLISKVVIYGHNYYNEQRIWNSFSIITNFVHTHLWLFVSFS